jgi:metalloendopeptidase OMA1, mitochondrial
MIKDNGCKLGIFDLMETLMSKSLQYYFLFLIFFLFGISGCAHDYVTGKSSYNWFKLGDDIGLGKQVLGAQLQEFKGKKVPVDESADKEMLNRLQTIVNNITAVSHLPNLPYEVHLADAPDIVNAWCAPGGKIMVYSGLWDPKKGLVHKDNDNEIAAVLSHEIAHATARHVTKSLSQNMTIMLAGTVVSSAIAAGGSIQGSNIFGQFFSTGFNIYAPSYSRKNEMEADRIGLFYMAKAGYDPRAAVEVWKRAAQKRGDAYSIYASHPPDGQRAKQLEAFLPQAIAIYDNPVLPYPDFGKLKMSKPQKQVTNKADKEKETSTPSVTPPTLNPSHL